MKLVSSQDNLDHEAILARAGAKLVPDFLRLDDDELDHWADLYCKAGLSAVTRFQRFLELKPDDRFRLLTARKVITKTASAQALVTP